MPLTASEVAAFKATDKRQNKSCGDSLVLVVEPISKGGGKSFMGVTRFPPRSPKNGGKRVEVRIGPYGKGVGKWTLKQARDEWDRIRAWSKEHNRDPRELKKEEKATPVEVSQGPTLAEVCESYCSASKNKTITELLGTPSWLTYQSHQPLLATGVAPASALVQPASGPSTLIAHTDQSHPWSNPPQALPPLQGSQATAAGSASRIQEVH